MYLKNYHSKKHSKMLFYVITILSYYKLIYSYLCILKFKIGLYIYNLYKLVYIIFSENK